MRFTDKAIKPANHIKSLSFCRSSLCTAQCKERGYTVKIKKISPWQPNKHSATTVLDRWGQEEGTATTDNTVSNPVTWYLTNTSRIKEIRKHYLVQRAIYYFLCFFNSLWGNYSSPWAWEHLILQVLEALSPHREQIKMFRLLHTVCVCTYVHVSKQPNSRREQPHKSSTASLAVMRHFSCFSSFTPSLCLHT